jgi:two-component system, LytTR family, response regulator
MIRAYLVERLERLLQATGRVEIAGRSTDAVDALAYLAAHAVDVVFLDIEMPVLSGFDLLDKLERSPFIVFTTAFDRYALEAFRVHSIDYLLKPIDAAGIERALDKLERMRAGGEAAPDLRAALEAVLRPRYPQRLASRVGDRVEFVELERVTHIYAEDKLTFAASGGKRHVLDATITELESRLDPEQWMRVHRSTLVQLRYVQEVHGFFGGRLVVRLHDAARTELTVARDRAAALKAKLGL